ncbi:hypothetical protein [Pseudomonas sp. B329]|uniref:hypothetical protein n=1 Tax=Pseudomonas sp. B329 TaxID=1553459 RepID=UPI002005D1B0|nr:hypothetical protein [Pseudomonas sp. B329]
MRINPLAASTAYRLGEGRPENNWLIVPTAPEEPPVGDRRTTRQIINANPALKHLFKRRDSYPVTDLLKRRLGTGHSPTLMPRPGPTRPITWRG